LMVPTDTLPPATTGPAYVCAPERRDHLMLRSLLDPRCPAQLLIRDHALRDQVFPNMARSIGGAALVIRLAVAAGETGSVRSAVSSFVPRHDQVVVEDVGGGIAIEPGGPSWFRNRVPREGDRPGLGPPPRGSHLPAYERVVSWARIGASPVL
jgi:hypothetical protein